VGGGERECSWECEDLIMGRWAQDYGLQGPVGFMGIDMRSQVCLEVCIAMALGPKQILPPRDQGCRPPVRPPRMK
jgi:hypothetical protein